MAARQRLADRESKQPRRTFCHHSSATKTPGFAARALTVKIIGKHPEVRMPTCRTKKTSMRLVAAHRVDALHQVAASE